MPPPLDLLVTRTAARCPDRVAVTDEDGSLTYAEVELLTDAVRERLAGAGVRPGDVVGVLLPRSRALPAALLGVHWAGAAYLPLHRVSARESVVKATGLPLDAVLQGQPLVGRLDAERVMWRSASPQRCVLVAVEVPGHVASACVVLLDDARVRSGAAQLAGDVAEIQP